MFSELQSKNEPKLAKISRLITNDKQMNDLIRHLIKTNDIVKKIKGLDDHEKNQ